MGKEAHGNGYKGRAATRRRMASHDKGYQGSEAKKRRPAAKYSFFGGMRWG